MSPPARPVLLPAVAVAYFASLWICSAAWAQARSVRTVLAIYLGAQDFPANPVLDAGIREALALRPELPTDFFAEYLDFDRFPVEEASLSLRDYIRRKYAGRRIDVVVAIADGALRFVLDHREELFPGAPIVFSGLAIPNEAVRTAGGGLTGVMRGIGFAETLRLALRLQPSTERVFVVARSNSQKTFDSVQAELREFTDRARLVYVNEETVPRLLDAVKAIPPRSLILYIWQTQEEPGSLKYPDEIARLVAQASPVPVYGTSDFYIGSGVVGGVVHSTSEVGARLGEMARRILDGTRARDIPIEGARVVPTFDWRQVQRWGIDPSRLPPGSDIRFRTPTVWESYGEYILAAVIVIAAQLLLIAGLLTQRARRRRAEETIRNREATLRTSYERIRQLAGRLINAQETARADIARDLHDDVCQELVGVSIAVSSLKRSSGRIQDAETQQALSLLEHWSLGVVDGVRRLSHDLHPATLRLLGLAAALKAHCIEVEKRHDVQVSFRTVRDLGPLHPDVAVCLFRIAQEALRNGAVHGEARRLGVLLVRSGDQIELAVTDDGRGFDLEAVRRDGSGLGLVSMEERARVAGGTLHILTRLRQGTTVRVRVPAGTDTQAETADARVHWGVVPPRVPQSSIDRR